MATIRARRQANGFTRYTAYIPIRRGKAVVHTESRTFAHRSAESKIPRDAVSAVNRCLRSSAIQVERRVLRVVTHDI